MICSMNSVGRALLCGLICFPSLLPAQDAVVTPAPAGQPGVPSSGGYKPPSLSLIDLFDNEPVLRGGMMAYARTGDRKAFHDKIFESAEKGAVGAELLLGEQFIPEQCPLEMNQDVPYCGKDGNTAPHVVFRENPLGVEASYEDAARWLEKASAHGSGEASEVLAQLITRMQANGHVTSYSAAASAHFHAIARSQGFDVEPIEATCFQLVSGGSSLIVGRLPGLIVGNPPQAPFTEEELKLLKQAGVYGSLLYGGGAGSGDSALLMRPEGAAAHVRVILDHNLKHEVLLPIPAHRDVIYLQRGETFLAFPSRGANLPRFLSITVLGNPTPQVSIAKQTMDGGYSGGFCTRFQ
jgi:hypothetical protein